MGTTCEVEVEDEDARKEGEEQMKEGRGRDTTTATMTGRGVFCGTEDTHQEGRLGLYRLEELEDGLVGQRLRDLLHQLLPLRCETKVNSTGGTIQSTDQTG